MYCYLCHIIFLYKQPIAFFYKQKYKKKGEKVHFL